MIVAPVLAFGAASFGVWGAWETLGVIDDVQLARRIALILRPLRLVDRSGHVPTVPERRRLAILGTAVLLVGGWLVAGPLVGLCLGAAGPSGVARLVVARRRRWRRRLADGVPWVARALADALAAGHSIPGGLQALGHSAAIQGPAGEELREVARRLALGSPTEVVLERLRRRASDPAWDTLVAAILLQRDAGGDLAGLLRTIANAHEAGRRAEAQARGITSQARATARLVAGMPFVGLALGELAEPGMLAQLITDPRSGWLVGAAFALGVLALVVVSRLAKVDEA